MSYGVEINNQEGKTLITEKITNHFVYASGNIPFQNQSTPTFPYPPPNAESTDLILMRPDPYDNEPYGRDNSRGLVAVDHWGTTQSEMAYYSTVPDKFDYLILRDFASTNIQPTGYGLSVFDSNGGHTYSSGYKNSNVEVMVTAEFLSSRYDLSAGLPFNYTTNQSVIDNALYGAKMTFQFDTLDDIYVAVNSTQYWALDSRYTIGYFFDFSNNTIDCVRGKNASFNTFPQDIQGEAGDYSDIHQYAGSYGIYKVTGL